LQDQLRGKSIKTILIAHYRVGHTDGVSLEIGKRSRLLRNMGHKVYLLSGPIQYGADFIIPELEYDQDPIAGLRKNSVEKCTDYTSAEELESTLFSIADTIEHQLNEIFEGISFDGVYIHNMLSMAVNLPASIALVRSLRKYGIPCVGVHHDFYWAGDFSTSPAFPFVANILHEYLIPQDKGFRHLVINSIDRQRMEGAFGISPEINYDVFDFEGINLTADDYNINFKQVLGLDEGDIVILHATRIVPNKAIEFAFQFTQYLCSLRSKLENRRLYHGHRFTTSNRIVLLLPGNTESARLWYKASLEEYARGLGIEALFLGDRIQPQRRTEKDKKVYSFWDSYVWADLVTYTSIWEGWGNQFIEAVAAKKNIVVFEYPVYKSDIAGEGYEVISLGDQYLPAEGAQCKKLPETAVDAAVRSSIDILLDQKKYRERAEKNYRIGKRHHSFAVLEEYLRFDLEWMEGQNECREKKSVS
jgi:mannosylglucosylglycerate synthase